MTELVFRDDSYAESCEATVTASGEQGIELDRTVFYPMGGGQPGDIGVLRPLDGEVAIRHHDCQDGGHQKDHLEEDGEGVLLYGISLVYGMTGALNFVLIGVGAPS